MSLSRKHKRTLSAIFARPTQTNIKFADIEKLVVALGGDVDVSRAGSRIGFSLKGRDLVLHRPHPGKEAKRYQVRSIQKWFEGININPSNIKR